MSIIKGLGDALVQAEIKFGTIALAPFNGHNPSSCPLLFDYTQPTDYGTQIRENLRQG